MNHFDLLASSGWGTYSTLIFNVVQPSAADLFVRLFVRKMEVTMLVRGIGVLFTVPEDCVNALKRLYIDCAFLWRSAP
jgi:hypothetical protein